MSNFPVVSVVIPTYNRARFIRATIDSVLCQTLENIEVIVVDDCSDDYEQLSELIDSTNDHRIRLLRHKVNRHGSAARNTGIKAARGEYIALLDSDDVWPDNKLAVYLEYEIGDSDVLYSKLVNADGQFPKAGITEKESVGDYLFLNNGTMQTSTLFMKTAFACAVLFDEELTRFQDYDFVVRLQDAGAKFCFVDHVLCEMLDYDDGKRISNSINFEPAVFWLNKIQHMLSVPAAKAFYQKRVVRLMVLSGKQALIFKEMPPIVATNLTVVETLKLRLLSLLPNAFYRIARFCWRTVKSFRT